MVNVGVDEDGVFGALENRLRALVLAKRVELADEAPPTRHEDARCLGEDEMQVLDMFEDEVADDEVGGMPFHRPRLCEIGFDKSDFAGFHLLTSACEHAGGKVEGRDAVAKLYQESSVLACATADLDDGREVLAGQKSLGDLLVEVTRAVTILVIRGGPVAVGVLNAHTQSVEGIGVPCKSGLCAGD